MNRFHICFFTERYSLFTLILLGESILASTNAVLEAIDLGEHLPDLLTISAAGLVIAAGMWWIYFSREQHHHITTLRSSLIFGYFHYLIFAAAGALSAGIEIEIDVLAGHGELHPPFASFAYTVPVAIFVLGVWALAIRPHGDAWVNVAVPLAGLAVLIDPLIPIPFALTSVILALMIAMLVWRRPRSRLGRVRRL